MNDSIARPGLAAEPSVFATQLRSRLGDASQRGMLVTIAACRRLLDGTLTANEARDVSALAGALHGSCAVAIDAIGELERRRHSVGSEASGKSS